jgi:hypothetical protein
MRARLAIETKPTLALPLNAAVKAFRPLEAAGGREREVRNARSLPARWPASGHQVESWVPVRWTAGSSRTVGSVKKRRELAAGRRGVTVTVTGFS